MKNIKENPDKPWVWDYVSGNPNLTMEFIKENPDKPWTWCKISWNQNITIKDIKENPKEPWYWYAISQNPNITMEFIKKNPKKPWDWKLISKNPNITMNDIRENPDLPWDCWGISENPNLTMEFIKENPDKNWEWDLIFKNPNIKMEDIERFILMPWDGVSNIYINIKKIFSNLLGLPFKNYKWNHSYGMNLNLTMSFIRKNYSKINDWSYISWYNIFNRDKIEFEHKQYRKHLAAYRIQQWWHRLRSDPRHPVGIRRLELEYEREFGSL